MQTHRGLAGLVLTVGAVLGLVACSGSGSSGPSLSASAATTEDTCAWTVPATQQPGRAVMITDDLSAYLLVDTSTGRVVDRCRPETDGISGRFAAVDQLPSYRGIRDSTDTVLANPRWFGGARPGGADGLVVATATGTLDLATGARTAVSVPGWSPVAVGSTSLIMARSDALHTRVQPVQPQDWCVRPLSGSGSCTPVPGASGSGSPVVAPNGSVVWLSDELTPSGITVEQGSASFPLLLRTGRGVVTALGVPPARKTDPPDNFVRGAGPDGRSFVVPNPAGSNGLGPDSSGRVIWYTLDAGRLTPHPSDTSWTDLAGLTATGGGSILDVAVAADGQTLYLLVNPLKVTQPGNLLVVVPQHAAFRVAFDTTKAHGNDPDYVASAHFLTVPASVTAT